MLLAGEQCNFINHKSANVSNESLNIHISATIDEMRVWVKKEHEVSI
jgi:hypothetical protein